MELFNKIAPPTVITELLVNFEFIMLFSGLLLFIISKDDPLKLLILSNVELVIVILLS